MHAQALPRHVYVAGAMVGYTALTNFEFDPNKPFAGCRICGDIFQTQFDRADPSPTNTPQQVQAYHDYCTELRKEWSLRHARKHHDYQHRSLVLSGAWCTPEAAQRLAAYGVIALTDMVMNDEVEHALRVAPRAPTADAQH